MCAVFLPWLTRFANICFSLCVDLLSDMAAANNDSVGAGSVLWFPPRTPLISTLADSLGVWSPVCLPFYPWVDADGNDSSGCA